MPSGRMAEIFTEISPKAVDLIDQLLLSGASAEIVANVLTMNGHKVSASTVKKYRRELRGFANDGE